MQSPDLHINASSIDTSLIDASSHPPPLLRVRGLSHSLGYRKVLKDIDLTLYRREIVCLQGPNGAGKTTLLKALSSPSLFQQGQLYFRGEQIRGRHQKRLFLQECSYLGHEPGLFLDMSVEQNLSFFLRCRYGHPGAGDRRRLEILLQIAGLQGLEHQKARSLSRGYRQRLGLARLLVNRPKLLLLDEPLSALDQRGQRILQYLLERCCRRGAAAIIAAHEESFFRSLASHFIFLRDGRLIANIATQRYTPQAQLRVRHLLYGENSP